MNNMSFLTWEALYKPLSNNFSQGAWFGTMFDIEGNQLAHVYEQDANNVWTLIAEGDVEYIVSGMYHINRLGYFVTDKPHNGQDIKITF